MKSKKKKEVPPWIQALGPPPTMVAADSETSSAPRASALPDLTREPAAAHSIDVPGAFSAVGFEIKGIGRIGNNRSAY
jgi:hypothetical protein